MTISPRTIFPEPPRLIPFDKQGEVKFSAGLHLMVAEAGAGKSTLALALADKFVCDALWVPANEPGFPRMTREVLFSRVFGVESQITPETVVIVDSFTQTLLEANSASRSASFKGGLSPSLAPEIATWDEHARRAGKVLVATLNSKVLPLDLDDASCTGTLIPQLSSDGVSGHVVRRDRVDRVWSRISFEQEELLRSRRRINMALSTASSPSAKAALSAAQVISQSYGNRFEVNPCS